MNLFRVVSFPVLVLPLLSLGACAVGPDFVRPAPPDTNRYDIADAPAQTTATATENGNAQNLNMGADIPAGWWSLFHSAGLNHLVDEAIKGNPDLDAAEASLRIAQENYAAAEGYLFPTISGSFSSTREKTSGAEAGGSFPGSIFTLHDASVSFSYGIDVFGGVRRGLEQLEAQTDLQNFELEAAYLTLTSNVVTAAIQEASLRGQIESTNEIIKFQASELNILKQQLALGGISNTSVLLQEAALEQSRALLPPLEKSLSQTRHLLSVLVGHTPDQDPDTVFTLDSLTLPAELPVSMPARLVEQRPDVRAAEATLHAASAEIGVTISNRLPGVTLSGSIGSESNAIDTLFSPGGGIWAIGGSVATTIFDFGTLMHKQGAAEAQFDMARAQYRKTVLSAFQNVADVLRALQSDAAALRAQKAASNAALNSLNLAEEQFRSGSTGYLELLTAQQTVQQTKINVVQAESLRFSDTAALFQALGGGWWNRTDLHQSFADTGADTHASPTPSSAMERP